MISFHAQSNPPPRKDRLKRGDDTTHFGGTAGREPAARQIKLAPVGLTLSAVGDEEVAYENKKVWILNYRVFTNIKTID